MNSLGSFTLFQAVRRAGVAGRICRSRLVSHFQRIGPHAFDPVFAVVIDEMISCHAGDPSSKGASFWPVCVQCSIHLQENFLCKIFGFIEFSRKAICQIVYALVVL